MADSVVRSDHKKKALHVLGFLSLLVLMQKVAATEFKVGGENGWSIPADGALHYNQWAERNRFKIGDSLLFVYPSGNDSVLSVNKDDYTNCNTATPLSQYNDGHTVFTFKDSGPHYFISGVEDNCLKNQKMVVVVLAERGNGSSSTSSPPPSPSSADIVPSPAPSGQESPSPSGQESPSPPVVPGEIVPSPAPTATGEEPSAPSGASSVFASFIGSIGALWLVGSSLLLA